MLRLPDPCLIVLAGPSAAGKSTWAAEHFPADVIVSSDHLRATVGTDEHDLAASAEAFDVLERIVTARIRRRLTTVLDTLGLDVVRRQRWAELAAKAQLPTALIAFDTPPAECRRRNALRTYRVPAAVISAQLATYQEQRDHFASEGWGLVTSPEPTRLVAAEVAAAASAARSTPAVTASGGAHDERPLRFGLHLSRWNPPGGPPGLRAAIRDVAGRAESAGFDSIWVMDHFRQIPQVGRAWEDFLESVATLGYLAAVTERLELGCLVHGVTYRNVGLLAKSIATLDGLSGGRAWCGLGGAWFEAEHAAFGWPFPSAAERLDLLDELCRR